MCGGRGERLDADCEKPLVEIDGVPMVERVRDALDAVLETVYAVTSPATPETRAALDPPIIDAPGAGYVEDLSYALDRVVRPVVTATADLPFLDAAHVRRLRLAHDDRGLAVAVPLALVRAIGVSVDRTREIDGRTVVPTGLGLVDGSETEWLVWDDSALAIEVDRPGDRALAEGYA
ncbi:cobalamin biosynthesis protein CobY [Halococcoides cellulosivorans]|uniref:Cobalamin biosynthesis protein CobY n=2 Tax=Halococcoides cellulosivorans TaxID=1679096 RepID=A0A2R4X4F0_9EURY|nr:cobalamin biosynthesis protein CobY [Halococcoides cellulosivorans]